MLQLLLIDVALCALLVVVAGCIMWWRWRGRRSRAGDRPGTAAELAEDGMAGRDTAVVPGFGDYPAEPDRDVGTPAGPDRGAGTPAWPEQAAPSLVSRVTGPAPDPGGPGIELNGSRPGPNGRRPSRAGQRAEPRANGAAGQAPDPDRPAAEAGAPRAAPNGQPAADPPTASDRIGSYYDEADRAMADYLAAMGWTEEPGDAPHWAAVTDGPGSGGPERSRRRRA